MRILLVTGNFFMAEGSIAKGIVEALDDDEIFFFSIHDFKNRFEEFVGLTKKVDIVHWLFNVGHLGEKYSSFYRDIKIPQVATVHHVDHDEFYKVEQASIADQIHVVSSEWLKYINKHSKTPTTLAYLGMFFEKFEMIQPKLYEGEGKIKIGMMGFYPGKNNRKRIDVAIQVFKSLIERKINFELVVQGGGWENYFEEFDNIGLCFKHIKLKSDESFLNFFEKIHVYLCTSDVEGGPLPVLESFAAGTPVVSTDVGMAEDLLIQGGGVICEKGNIENLTEALIQIKNNNNQYKKLANQTKGIAHNYDWINLKQQYQVLYNNTIKSWEQSNSSTWEYRNNKIVEAIEQREKELVYGNIQQVRSLLQNNNLTDGIRLLIVSIFSKKLDFVSKGKLFYESTHFLLRTIKK